jgi:hypothetical protein
MTGCGAPVQTADLPAGVDLGRETVVAGRVVADGSPVGGAFVRLLNADGEFAAEVVSSPEGSFLFYAAAGDWTVRALHRRGNGTAKVTAHGPGLHPVELPLTP